MSEATKTVKVLSDARETEILGIFRLLHGKVLVALQECEIKPQFPTEFEKCGAVDTKVFQQQARALINSKVAARAEARLAGIRKAIQGAISSHMEAAWERKAKYDAIPAEHREFLAPFPTFIKVPLKDMRALLPKDMTDKQVFDDLTALGFKVTEVTDKGTVLVPFTPKVAPEAPKAEKVAEAPTKEEEGPTAAAAE